MAKSHYSFKKRKKELARKLKQEQKRQRKFDKDTIELKEAIDKSEAPEVALDRSQDQVPNPLKYEREFVLAESDWGKDVIK
jgi:hypothetical protein